MEFSPSKTRFRTLFSTPIRSDDEDDQDSRIPVQSQNTNPEPDGSDNTVRQATKKLMDLYGEPSESVERYNQHIANQPIESDYKPSGKRRLGAALAGFAVGLSDPESGSKVAQNIIDEPFKSALNDWTRQEGPLKAAATTEASNRTAKINALKDYITAEHQATTDAQNAKHQHTTELQAQSTLAETIARDQAAEASRIQAQKDREEDNRRQADRDKETARHNLETEKTGRANTENTKTRLSIYRSSQDNLNAYRDSLTEKMKSEKPGTPSAQRTAKELATHDVILTPGNSQKYADFYDMDEKGRVHVTPPNKGMFSSDEDFNKTLADYSKFLKEIDDHTNTILRITPTKPSGKPGETKAPNTPRVVKKEIVP